MTTLCLFYSSVKKKSASLDPMVQLEATFLRDGSVHKNAFRGGESLHKRVIDSL